MTQAEVKHSIHGCSRSGYRLVQQRGGGRPLPSHQRSYPPRRNQSPSCTAWHRATNSSGVHGCDRQESECRLRTHLDTEARPRNPGVASQLRTVYRLHGSHSRIPVGHLKIGLIAETRVPYLTNAALGDPRIDQEWSRREGIVAFAGYPLVVDDRVVGVIAMFARLPIGSETLETIGSIAGILAQGIERKRSQKELRRAIKANHGAVLGERTRIAREMHDGVLQNVTGIALQLRAVLPRVRSAPEEAATVLERILELTERTSTEARLAVVGMRHFAESGDVVEGAASTVERALEESALGLSVNVRGRTRAISPRVCDAATLIVQQAIINVLRHAQAQAVQLAVEFGIRRLRISIRDDGRGFVPDHGVTGATHFGLQGMRERAREIGAELRVRSALKRGTTVSVLVPYPPK